MKERFRISALGPADLPRLLEIQEEAFAMMDDKSLLRRNTPKMLACCLSEPHVTLGAWEGDALAGFYILYRPTDMDENLAHCLLNIDLTEKVAANSKLCIVRPAYRGEGLQRILGTEIERVARNLGIDLLCGTASPNNMPSCNNFIKQGYTLNRRLEKYGFTRNLYFKFLQSAR